MNRQRFFLTVACVAALAAQSGPAHAIDPNETDARLIMQTVEGRDLGDRILASFTMAIRDASGRERNRSGVVRTLTHDGARKGLILFENPADIRGAGLLTWDWDERAKADDQWLYLPALNRTTRITGAGRSGSFMGSDLTFADMTRRNAADYDYTMVTQSTQVDGEDCWLIEGTPTNPREREETGYAKARVWVSKDKLVPLQIAATLAKGGLTKRTKFYDIRKVDGIWTAHKLVLRTDKGDVMESMTTMVWVSYAYNRGDIVPAVFTTQRLEKGL